MDLIRHLSFFVAVAEEGHFGHAAQRLGMTQPPLSQGVRRLEQRIGADLVRRGTRGATLTDAGRELLPRARLLVADATRFDEEARRVSGGSDTSLRWGVTPTVADELVMRCVTELRGSEESSIRVSTTTESSNELVAAVRDGLLDVAVVDHPAVLTGTDCGPILALRRWFVVPGDHPLAKTEKPQVRSLRGLELGTRPRSDNQPAHDLFLDTLRARGLDPEVRVTNDFRDQLCQVAAGECFGVTTAAPRPIPGVAWVDMLRGEVAARVRIVWRTGDSPKSAVSALDRVLSKVRL